MLGDMGADVIKVEPLEGEYLRHTGPFYKGQSLYCMEMNRNKRDIAVNTREKEGRELLVKMFRDADIVVNNYKPGVMEKMGFTWEYLHELNPRLILVSISGWGQTGPKASQPGFDSLAQAAFGLMSMTGPSDGEPYLAGSFLWIMPPASIPRSESCMRCITVKKRESVSVWIPVCWTRRSL